MPTGLVLMPGLFVPADLAADPMPRDREWPVYGGDFAGTKYSPLRQIHRTNVHRLQPAWIYRCDDMRTGGLFLPPGTQPSIVLPQFNGGGEWGGGAFELETRLFYVNASNEAEWISMVPSKARDDMTVGELGRMIHRTICSACHGFERVNNPAARHSPRSRQ